MSITLDHTIVPAHDKVASAKFFAGLFGLEYQGPMGPFAPVRINETLTLDFDDRWKNFEVHHYAFHVSDSEFDAIFARNGLRITGSEIEEQSRPFDHWLEVAGWKPGDTPYEEARRLLESTLENDGAGFHARRLPAAEASEGRGLEITNTILLLAGEKI